MCLVLFLLSWSNLILITFNYFLIYNLNNIIKSIKLPIKMEEQIHLKLCILFIYRYKYILVKKSK